VTNPIERLAQRSTLLPADADINEQDLRDALPAIVDALTARELQPTLEQTPGGLALRIQEDERQHQITLAHLARNLNRLRMTATPTGIERGVAAWVEQRPITDAQATASGIAALSWADETATRVGWQVYVPRGATALPWTPSRHHPATSIRRIRSAALGRAHTPLGTLQVTGNVALWTVDNLPIISTALLVDPDWLLMEMTRADLNLRDPHAIIAPGRPVACATADAARRLAGETAAPHAMLPWRALADLSWV
jgi:hypothetical protein